MRFHDVHIFYGSPKLDVFFALVADGADFLLFKLSLRYVLLGLFLGKFELFGRVPGAMQHTCLFCTGRRIARMACITSIVISSADPLRVGWRGGSSSLLLPAKTGMVGFCPLSIFRRCSSLVDRFRDFHVFKHVVCFLVGPPSEVPSLDVCLSCPRVWDGV